MVDKSNDDDDDDGEDDDDRHDHHDDHTIVTKPASYNNFNQTTSAKPPTRKPDRTKRVVGKVSGCYGGWG